MDRQNVLRLFGSRAQDAVTFVELIGPSVHYIVAYNQQLSFVLIQRAIARELAHIVLGHDGSLPEDVRAEEARCFAHHLITPRPLIHAVCSAGVALTKEVLGNLTGCYDHCLSSIRTLPPVFVPADLNRTLRDQFAPYVENFLNFQRIVSPEDDSPLADLGNYMEGYEE